MMITIPARPRIAEEKEVEVVCDPLFLEAVALASGPLEAQQGSVECVVKEHLNAGRPKREKRVTAKILVGR